MKSKSWARWIGPIFIFGALVTLVWAFQYISQSNHALTPEEASSPFGLNKSRIARAISSADEKDFFPSEVNFNLDGESTRTIVQYSFDPTLQEKMEDLFRSYRPDYGAFVAMDATTGRILSLVSYVHNDSTVTEHMALKAGFPSASIFKVVTAAAAIEENRFSSNTVVSFTGRNHTLYKSHLFNEKQTRWTRHMTLREAFAKSVNTVFGKIGVFNLGGETLRTYADRFAFNRAITSDLIIEQGKAPISDDPWEIAEAASGFTRDNTMSPLQGALIAAAVANDGKMMEPYVVQSVHTMDGTEIYSPTPREFGVAVDSATAAEIRKLMKATVTNGTSKKAFRGFFRKEMKFVEVGGKTGSLTGTSPKGKYDWFVGYAYHDGRKIALASLTVHQKLWRVKSSYLARRAIEQYFTDAPATTPERIQKSRLTKDQLAHHLQLTSAKN